MSSKKDINQKKYKVLTKRNYRNYKKSKKKKGGFGIKSAVAVAALAGLAAGNLAATDSQKSISAIEKANIAYDEEKKIIEIERKNKEEKDETEREQRDAKKIMYELLQNEKNPFSGSVSDIDFEKSEKIEKAGLKNEFIDRYKNQMLHTIKRHFTQKPHKLKNLDTKQFNDIKNDFNPIDDKKIFFFLENKELFSDFLENLPESSPSSSSSKSSHSDDKSFNYLKLKFLDLNGKDLHPEKPFELAKRRLYINRSEFKKHPILRYKTAEVVNRRYYLNEFEVSKIDKSTGNFTYEDQVKKGQNNSSKPKYSNGYDKKEEYDKDRLDLLPLINAMNQVRKQSSYIKRGWDFFNGIPWAEVENQFNRNKE